MRREGELTGPEPSVTFATLLLSVESEQPTRRAVASLREFGGTLASSRVLVFAPSSLSSAEIGQTEGVEFAPLAPEPGLAGYPFGTKVTACAQAEALVPRGTTSLVWLGPGCLVFRPPEQFVLGTDCDAAFRPVHITNVGSLRSGPLDEYWKHVYETVGTQDGDRYVESLLGKQQLRPYYNTHCFAVNPALGLMAEWLKLFRSLVADEAFQSGPCRDELHRIFLHQAVLSALVTKSVAPGRVRVLPPEYSYPLHFHEKLADTQRVDVLNDITVAAYEEESDLAAVRAEEPLRSWLERHRQTP
jgi:hypothetical protein